MSLDVVAFEYPGDPRVPPGNEMPRQHISAAEVVIRYAHRAVQFAVAAVEEDHRDIGPSQLVIEVQVGIGEGCLGPLHNEAAHRLAEELLEDLPLLVQRVPGGKEHGGIVALREKLLYVLKDCWKDVVVNIGCHDGDAAASPDYRLGSNL